MKKGRGQRAESRGQTGMKMLGCVGVVLFASTLLHGQEAPARLQFEVASVRPSQSSGQERVGVRMDGSQVHVGSLPLRDCVAMAYRVKWYQVIGPEWMTTEKFDVSAKLPTGSTPSQIPEMMQSLLADRFGLRLHRDKKDLPVYAVVIGKPPLRLKESVIDPDAPVSQAAVNIAASGSAAGVSVDLGNGSYYSFANNTFEARKVRAATLAAMLERYADRPLFDMTELKGTYDFSFDVTPEDYQAMMIRAAVNSGVVLPPQALRLLDGGSNALADALDQLGLKLDSRKAPLDMWVIDQALKTPTDN